ncbi:hypothetical protein [Isoptericola sp. NPDC057559]|uniref:hypothetical protein n=1 Tax=Isoptericola sp. NPDC057559 TaxID=3346168 RepID=UPI0036AC43A5
MQARAITVAALVTAALLAEPLAAAGAPSVAAAPSGVQAASVAASVAAGHGDDLTIDGRAVDDRAVDDTVRWQSAATGVSPDLARSTVRAQADRRVHQVDVAVATPRWMSKARAAQLIRDQDVDALLAKVSTYWSTQSGGRITFVRSSAIKRVETGDGSCSTTGRIISQVKAGGRAHYGSGWWDSSTRGPGRREHLVVLFPYVRTDFPGGARFGDTCAGTLGLGSLPGAAGRDNPGGWSFSLFGGADGEARSSRFSHAQYATAVSTLAHELGHNMGLEHSGVGWCRGAADGGFTSTRCGAVEGLDPMDLMGADFAAVGTAPLSRAQLKRLGVLPASDIVTVTKKGGARTVTIDARHRSTSRPTLLRAVDPKTGQYYSVELRRQSGARYPYLGGMPWRAADDYTVSYGVTVSRFGKKGSTWAIPGEHLIVPMGKESARKSYLLRGSTFTTRSGALRLTVRSTTDGTATLRVTFPRT